MRASRLLMRASMLGSRCVCDLEVGVTRSAETTKRSRKRLRVLFMLMLSLGKFQIRSLPSFFFQAEDGIRVGTVTGVQTCALPICERFFGPGRRSARAWPPPRAGGAAPGAG